MNHHNLILASMHKNTQGPVCAQTHGTSLLVRVQRAILLNRQIIIYADIIRLINALQNLPSMPEWPSIMGQCCLESTCSFYVIYYDTFDNILCKAFKLCYLPMKLTKLHARKFMINALFTVENMESCDVQTNTFCYGFRQSTATCKQTMWF